MRDYALLYINGVRHEVRGADASMMLADYLREELNLSGTKIVCAEGDCGACSVLRSSPLNREKTFQTINSCITTIAQMDCSQLITVEGIARGEELSPVQKSMVEKNASQCGYCTPGFVCALSGLVEKRLKSKDFSKIEEKETKNFLTGNLCRCTGYVPFIEATAALDLKACEPLWKKFDSAKIEKELLKAAKSALHITSKNFSIQAPLTEKEAQKCLEKEKKTRIIAAGTDLGVLVNKNKMEYEKLLSLHLVKSLYATKKVGKNRFFVGARATLADLRSDLSDLIPEFSKFLDLFASPQIKAVATLVGNIANASPIADSAPFLLATHAEVVVQSKTGKRKIPLDKFYVDYRKTLLKPADLILGLEFDIPEKKEFLRLKKSSIRKDLDISCVNAAFRMETDKSKAIEHVTIAYGGVAATPLRLKKTESLLKGQKYSAELLKQAIDSLQSEIKPLSDLRGSSSFRRLLAENLLTDFLSEAFT